MTDTMTQPALAPQPDAPPAGLRVGFVTELVNVLVCVVLVGVIHLQCAGSPILPTWSDDEGAPLLQAARLAGVLPDLVLPGLTFDLGWSLVLVPSWWLADGDPLLAYRYALLTGVVVATALVLPLWRLARGFGLGRLVAPWAAGAVALAPARSVASTFVITENLLTLLVACTALAGMRMWRSPRIGRGLTLVLCVTAVFVTHQRTAGLVAATAVALFAQWPRQPKLRLPALVLPVAVGAGYLMNKSLVAWPMYQQATGRESTMLGKFLDPQLGAGAIVLTGQVWYHTVAVFGLGAVGGAYLAASAFRELRDRRVGPAAWWAGVVVASLAVLILWIGRGLDADPTRWDSLMYGRYLEPVMVPVGLLGLAALLRGRHRPALVGLLLIGLGLLGRLVVLGPLTVDRPAAMAINIGGLLPWPAPAGDTWTDPSALLPAALAVAVIVFALVVGRSPAGRALIVAGVLVLGVGLSVQARRSDIAALRGPYQTACSLRQVVPVLGVTSIGFDTREIDGAPRDTTFKQLSFCLAPHPLRPFDSATDPIPAGVVVGPVDWAAGQRVGARLIARDHAYAAALWVLPGPDLQRLSAAGLVAADPLTSPTTLGAGVPQLHLQVPTDPVRTSSAQPGTLRATVTCHDCDRIWPELGAPDPDGALRVVIWWPDGTPMFAELPRMLLPDDQLTVDIHLSPSQGTPPGMQSVRVQLLGQGIGGLGEAVPVQVEVTD